MITINLAEADDAERETAAAAAARAVPHAARPLPARGRPLLLGPADCRQPACSRAFRDLFGDERADYGEALQAHYQNGPPADWQSRSSRRTPASHPWEDWAETWAHYLHMTDTLETAAACGVSLKPRRRDEPALPRVPDPAAGVARAAFDG